MDIAASIQEVTEEIMIKIVKSLKDEYLERVIVKNGKYVDRESVYKPGNRVRDVEVGPSGKIYVALEDPGRIVVLSQISKN